MPSVADIPHRTNGASSRIPSARVSPTRVPSRAPDRESLKVLGRTSEVFSDYTAFPLSTSGKLFAVDSIGQLFVCSATVVNSDNLSVVWTAGHCLHDGNGGEWVHGAMFVPAYKDGSAPLGEWPVIDAYVPVGWTDYDELWQYDMAAFVVEPQFGTAVVEVAGGRGISWNESQDQFFVAYGYPASGGFNGERMYACDSSVIYLADYLSPPPQGIACDMTPGSSGGGWIVQDEYLNSNTSFGAPTVLPGVLFGPYFNDTAGELFRAASSAEVPGLTPGAPIDVTQTRYDANDSRSRLDVRAVRIDVFNETVHATVQMHDQWSSSLLQKPSNNIYIDFDPQRDGESDYYAWIYASETGRLIASVEQYTTGESQTVGFGQVRRLNRRTVRVSFNHNLLQGLGETLGWSGSTRFRNRTACPRSCWDYTPNRGMHTLPLY